MSLIEPLDYLSLVHLMKRSTLILTDSGGIQEEAPGLQVPVLVMRDTTERPEGIDNGVVQLVGTQRSRIVTEGEKLLRDPIAQRLWQPERIRMVMGTRQKESLPFFWSAQTHNIEVNVTKSCRCAGMA